MEVLKEAGVFRKEFKSTIHRKHKKLLAQLINKYNTKLSGKNKIKLYLQLITKKATPDGEDLYNVKVESGDLATLDHFVDALKSQDPNAFK